MNTAINFYELKSQLHDLGYSDPAIADELRTMVLSNKELHDVYSKQDGAEFTLSYQLDPTNGYQLYCVDASMDIPGKKNQQVMQYLLPDVPVPIALELLKLSVDVRNNHDPFRPMSLQQTEQYIHSLKLNHMNTQNLEFLKKSLLNLGFGEQVNKALEKNIEKELPDFTLMAKHEFNQQQVNYTLHFKAGENKEMYFFNKFDTTLHQGQDQQQSQSFYINKGNGITAKEAFNLMEGRAVHKQLFNKDGEKYQAWLQLDSQNLTQNGNKEIKRFNENYGFDLENVLSGKGIKELNSPEGAENLYRSLKKGNAQQITVERDGNEKKYFIAASPQFKTVDLYDHQMKKIKREELLKPEQKKATSQKQGKQQKEGLPAKKHTKKNKIGV
jgi:hypothetical protein